jgi:acyl-CoA synthetase (AMP-forming)/AMP-acid ligase II
MPIRAMTPELIGPYYEQGLWRPETLTDLLDAHVRRTPGALAVADQHERLTYAEFAERSAAFAGWLISREVQPGSVVAIQTGNRVSLALAHLACSRADLVFVPLSTHWRRTEMESLLRRSGVSVLVLPPATGQTDFFATVNAMRGDLPRLRLVGGTGGLAADFDFDAVLKTGPAVQSGPARSGPARSGPAQSGPAQARPRRADDPRFITITSGTTDTPKMSQWTDNNLSFLLRDYAGAVGMGPGDVAAAIAPANTGATGYLFPVLAPLLCGAGAVLLEDWEPAAALNLLEAERATHAAAIPTQLVRMLQDPRIGARDFSAVRVITSAGAPLTPDTAQQTEETFGCAVTTVYGSTDGGVITVTRTTDPVAKRRTTVGRPIPGGEVVLRDPLGDPVPDGTPGEVTWRTPTKSFGYLNDDERTGAMFRGDGWFYSGDLGSLDEDGYLSITGRSKDLIIRGGQNISPLEIEQIVARHGAVSEVAVVGIPDPVFGERTCACVVLRPGVAGLALDELTGYMQAQEIAPYKLPERLEIFAELPRTAGGKLSKVTLRSEVVERMAAR